MLPNLLPSSLAPYAKAVYPLLAAAGAAVASWIATGDFSDTEIRAAAAGAVLALVGYLVPNQP